MPRDLFLLHFDRTFYHFLRLTSQRKTPAAEILAGSGASQ